ncbi:hypothetical protein WME91_28850 [Sorangium sp. So ce269]
MPSMIHEALLHLFRNRPVLAAEVLRDTLGAPVPRFTEARIEPADLTEIVPVEHRADLVVLLLDGRPVLAIVVEAQLGRDPDKEYAWPSYVVGVRARYRCRACLLVATTDEAIATWSAEPIDLGPPDWTGRAAGGAARSGRERRAEGARSARPRIPPGRPRARAREHRHDRARPLAVPRRGHLRGQCSPRHGQLLMTP